MPWKRAPNCATGPRIICIMNDLQNHIIGRSGQKRGHFFDQGNGQIRNSSYTFQNFPPTSSCRRRICRPCTLNAAKIGDESGVYQQGFFLNTRRGAWSRKLVPRVDHRRKVSGSVDGRLATHSEGAAHSQPEHNPACHNQDSVSRIQIIRTQLHGVGPLGGGCISLLLPPYRDEEIERIGVGGRSSEPSPTGGPQCRITRIPLQSRCCTSSSAYKSTLGGGPLHSGAFGRKKWRQPTF